MYASVAAQKLLHRNVSFGAVKKLISRHRSLLCGAEAYIAAKKPARTPALPGELLRAQRRLRHASGLGLEIVAVHAGDEVDRDLLGTDGLALGEVGAGAEAFLLHRLDHGAGALGALGLALRQEIQVRDLGGGEELRRAVR